MDFINAETYLNLIRSGAARLSQERESINNLNVFPIPDGDTGDNMYMTIEAGTRASGDTLSDVARSVSEGMLLGARGNSGVILSRIFAGLAKGFEGYLQADIQVFSQAMDAAVKEAYTAVSKPVEGTILTVLREGVDSARGSSSLDEYFDLWIAGMDLSLQHTPDLLDVLKKAGVVDSGGAGLLCIGEGMRAAFRGESITLTVPETAPQAPKVDFSAFTEDSVLEFGYCTEFLLRLQRSKVDLETFDETVISSWLASKGDSLVFFRDGSIIKVHVHTMDPGEILSHCRQWGEFLTIKVENMTLQHHENHMDERFKKVRKPLGVVAVASGDGLCAHFREMGVDEVIPGGQTMNPPVDLFLQAFDRVAADTLLVLPNNSNIVLTARQAASLYKDARVEVIPTKSLGEGYYAAANLDLDLTADELIPLLTEAAGSVVTGMVSQAIRDAEGVREGDWIGFTGKEILCASPDRITAVKELASRLDAPSADVLMLLTGKDVPEEEVEILQTELGKTCPRTEVIPDRGGQPVYDYILILC